MSKAREDRLRQHWDEGAERFDAMIAPMERRFLAESRAWVAERAKGDVLEVAVGTGLSLPYYGPGTDLTAVELSEGMLRVARRRIERLGLSVDSLIADGQDLPFGDGSFDAVVCTYSLCGFADHRRGVEEMVRVLRPGGSLLLADHVGSTNPALRAVQWLLEAVTIPLQGEHWTRRPRLVVEAMGLQIVDSDRLHHGLIERLHARRR
ncbi:class I SAM-dependent methyltransferase [Tessaracoccus sp. Z1128]